jgi:hypothetical protein
VQESHREQISGDRLFSFLKEREIREFFVFAKRKDKIE